MSGVSSATWHALARRRSVRGASLGVIAAAVAAALVMLLPSGAVARLRRPRAGDALEREMTRPAGASRLSPLVARVMPPAYSGQSATALDEPTDVRALAGSRVLLQGRGESDGVFAVVNGDTMFAQADTDRWIIDLGAPRAATVVSLSDRDYHRVVAIEPVVDHPPVVTLTSPMRDSVLRQPKGIIALSAEASDDFGIASAAFEYIISSGEGENFTFRSGTIAAVRPQSKRVSLTGTLSLQSLGLKPGDVVHLRAVARDANNVTGPGAGGSDTRSIRIARPDEYDSLAVEAAAPSEADKSLISERMLITLAEALERRRAALPRDTLVRESRSIAADQARLRRSLGEITDSAAVASLDPIDFETSENGQVGLSKSLLEAYNAMWDASGALETGEPAKALPHMRQALAALQRAHQAERVYLRGRAPLLVLDLAKVRLTGKDKGASSTRAPLAASDERLREITDRFLRVLDLADHSAPSAADSLLVLRIDALATNPEFAAAAGDAANAIRGGNARKAAAALVAARRALAGAPVARDSIARWGIVP